MGWVNDSFALSLPDIQVLVNSAPVHTALSERLRHQVKPDACAAPIAFHKRMNHAFISTYLSAISVAGPFPAYAFNGRNDS